MAETSAEANIEIRMRSLLALRRSDGGYSYRAGGEGLAETTCYALLACKAMGHSDTDVRPSLDWLAKLQREDGGFAPQPAVGDVNWVSSLAALTMGAYGRADIQRKAIEWLLGQAGAESAWLPRTIRNTLGIKPAYPQNHHGWPWWKGNTAWLMPTALGMLALLAAQKSGRFSDLDGRMTERLEEGRLMLLDRRCADGGWNHGAPSALEVKADSYPETTGMALLAMQGVSADKVPGAEELARRMLASNRFANAVSWLQLGLNAREQPFEVGEEKAIQCRNCLDNALRVLALQAIAGNNIFRA